MLPTDTDLKTAMEARVASGEPSGTRPKPLPIARPIVEHGIMPPRDIDEHLTEVNRRWSVRATRPLVSHRPLLGGAITFLKRVVRKAISWYVNPMVEAQTDYNASATRLFNALTSWASTAHRQHEATAHALQYDIDALAAGLGELSQSVQSLGASIEAIDTASRQTAYQATAAIERLNEWSPDWLYHHPELLDYKAFQNAFRGTEDEIAARQSIYLTEVSDADGIVLDLGCGRGEFLRACRDQQIPAMGVDLDQHQVALLREEGFDVCRADLLDFLADAPEEHFGAILLLQVIEHLPFGRTIQVLRHAHRVLRAGGKLIMETVNPCSLFVFTHALYVDPTHLRPIHPLTLQFCVEANGFKQVVTRYLSPIKESEVLQADHDLSWRQNMDRLNHHLFGPQDYCVIGRKEVAP